MKRSRLHAQSSFRRRPLMFPKVSQPVCHFWFWNSLSLSFQRSEVFKSPSRFKAEPQMVRIIVLQSKPGSATSLHRPGCPLGRCRRLPLLRVQNKSQFYRQNRCPPHQDYIHKSRTFVPTVPVLQYWKPSRMRNKFIVPQFQEPVFPPCSIWKSKTFADTQYSHCPRGACSLTWPRSPSISWQPLPLRT